MLSPYRRIFAFPGAALFSAAAAVCRSPIAMVTLATVLLVQARTGSYALAGAVSATLGVANGVGAALQGRLADRLGQRAVLPVAVLIFDVGLLTLAWATSADLVIPVGFVGAALIGLGIPQAGSMVRTRWRHSLPDRGLLQTAFAFEAVIDEVIFMAGPVLVVALATSLHPVTALAVPGALGTIGAVALAVQRRTEPPLQSASADSGPPTPMGWLRLTPIIIAIFGQGAIFGAAEVVTVAFAAEHAAPRSAAVLLALWAGGSLLAGLVVGGVGADWPPVMMFRVASLALTLSFVPMLVVTQVWQAALIFVISGIAISPALVAAMSLVERTVPAARLTEGIGWTTTGITLGVAAGAAASGAVIDVHGASIGFAVPLAAGALATVGAFLVRVRAQPAGPAPTVPQQDGGSTPGNRGGSSTLF